MIFVLSFFSPKKSYNAYVWLLLSFMKKLFIYLLNVFILFYFFLHLYKMFVCSSVFQEAEEDAITFLRETCLWYFLLTCSSLMCLE